jgi:hypothetical protein
VNTAFLCHSSNDKLIVRKVAADLERYGVKTWLDENEIRVGDSLRQSIEKGLNTSDFVIVFLSESATKKDWVQRELSAAFSLELEHGKKVILPVLVGDCQIPIFLKDKKYADFREDYEHGLKELLIVLGKVTTDSHPQNIETISCTVTIDIKRIDGSLAYYKKDQRIRCISGYASNYVESFSTDGQIDSFQVASGTIGKHYVECGSIYIPTYFDRQIYEGETYDRTFNCKWHNSFTEKEEYWEEKQHHPSKDIEINIRFPKTRPPIRYWALEKSGSITKETKWTPQRLDDSGNPLLRLIIVKPKFLCSYILRWIW